MGGISEIKFRLKSVMIKVKIHKVVNEDFQSQGKKGFK